MAGANIRASGIYAIRNTVTGRVYVGSASNFAHRWRMHRFFLQRGDHHSTRLQNSWNKHGADVFQFEIMEHVVDHSALLDREQYWLDFHQAAYGGGYNICPTAMNVRGIKRRAETKAKIAAAHFGMKATDEARANMSAAAKGKIISVDARAKMSAAGLAGFRAHNAGKIMPDEQKAKISATLLKRRDDPNWQPSTSLLRIRVRRAAAKATRLAAQSSLDLHASAEKMAAD